MGFLGLEPAGPVERALWILLIALVGAFLAGTWLNRQRSKAIGMWLQKGIGMLGGRVAWRWIKSVNSGAEVTIAETRPPFRQLVISYFLLTREFPPLWGIELLRGKRDLLSVRGDLRRIPEREFEIVPLQGKLRKTLDTDAGAIPLQWREMRAGLGLATRGEPDRAVVQRVMDFLNVYGPYVERFSLRKRSPNVIAFLRLTKLESGESADLLKAVGELVKG
jgi:hypothetical protein